MHEQYRPFVLFHRTQAAALGTLERDGADAAVAEINAGMKSIREVLAEDVEAGDVDEDELLAKLAEMKDAVAEHYDVQPPLSQQLADAIAAEQYELAAQLRDQLGSTARPSE